MQLMMMKLLKYSLLFFAYCLFLGSCQPKNREAEQELIIFHAGSLSVPVKQISDSFMAENPGTKILLESAGSVACARKITDLKKDCDIMISSDYKVIDHMLIPDYANWNIKFASNEMALVFTPKSKYQEQINSQNWYDILLKPEVAYGRSDPNSDPCGYRTVQLTQLAEKYYNETNLSKKLIEKDKNYIRPKEVDLLGLLESNAIDYIFIYKSVALQHQLPYLTLPDSINLKNAELTGFYAMASVEITGDKPGELKLQRGEPMVYGITQLKKAPNSKLASKFIAYFLDKEKGMKIMEINGQPSVIPSPTLSFKNIPAELQQFAKNKD